jgi:BT1 family
MSHIDLTLLTTEERQAEILRCEKMNKHFIRMMYFISSNSGFFSYNTNVNYYYISETLKRSTKDYLLFGSYQGLAWSLKPIYGWVSDSIYPFTYRYKPYIFLFCLLHILACLYVILNDATFEAFTYCYFVMNISVAFIDAMAQGITAINTKISSKIEKLREAERRKTGIILGEE